jgi:hypothetical protein
MRRLKAVLPWVVQVFAGGWLRDRALHAPEADLPGLAAAAAAKARLRSATPDSPAPEDWWRAVEETQAEYVTQGVVVRS